VLNSEVIASTGAKMLTLIESNFYSLPEIRIIDINIIQQTKARRLI
jgi:hypothetical protein